MNFGQTMLTAAFIVLVSVAILNANRLLIQSEEGVYEADAVTLAANAAQALLIEASRKKFDEWATDTVYQSPADFTPSSQLGPSFGETLASSPDAVPFSSPVVYNDVDDYHGYKRNTDLGALKGFLLSTQVYYVNTSTPDVRSTPQTYFKRIDVTVEHPVYLSTPLTFSSIVTY